MVDKQQITGRIIDDVSSILGALPLEWNVFDPRSIIVACLSATHHLLPAKLQPIQQKWYNPTESAEQGKMIFAVAISAGKIEFKNCQLIQYDGTQFIQPNGQPAQPFTNWRYIHDK